MGGGKRVFGSGSSGHLRTRYSETFACTAGLTHGVLEHVWYPSFPEIRVDDGVSHAVEDELGGSNRVNTVLLLPGTCIALQG